MVHNKFLEHFLSSDDRICYLEMLSLISFPSITLMTCKMLSNSLPFAIDQCYASSKAQFKHKNPECRVSLIGVTCLPLCTNLIQRRCCWTHESNSLQAFSCLGKGRNEPGEEDEDYGALDRLSTQYAGFKNKVLSCVIADKFVSFLKPFHGNKVFDVFSYALTSWGKSIEFNVKPELENGMSVGLSWRLEWKSNNLILGKGFSFHTSHVYQGRLQIRNVGMLLEFLEPFRLELMEQMTNVLHSIGACATSKRKKAECIVLLFLLSMAALLFYLKSFLP